MILEGAKPLSRGNLHPSVNSANVTGAVQRLKELIDYLCANY